MSGAYRLSAREVWLQRLLLAAACSAILGDGPPAAAIAPPDATVDTSDARRAYELARTKTDDLQALSADLSSMEEARQEVLKAASRLPEEIADVPKGKKLAQEALLAGTTCLTRFESAIEHGIEAAVQFRSAAGRSVLAASHLALSPEATLAMRTDAEGAFAERYKWQEALRERSAEGSRIGDECLAQMRSTQDALGRLEATLRRVRALAADLMLQTRAVRNAVPEIVAHTAALRERGWLDAPATPPALPSGEAVRSLREAAERLTPPDATVQTSSLEEKSRLGLAVHRDVSALVVEKDARAYTVLLSRSAIADCTRTECADLQDQAEESTRRAASAEDDVARDLYALEAERNTTSAVRTKSAELASWDGGFADVVALVDRALQEAQTTAATAGAFQSELSGTVKEAFERVLTERATAYARAFGVSEPDLTELLPGLTAGTSGVMAPNFEQRLIADHVFEVVTATTTESSGYGAYTYVILGRPSTVGGAAGARYQALLEALVATTLPRSSLPADLSAEQRLRINLFVIPGKSDEVEVAGSLTNYDDSLSNSWRLCAGLGVLARNKALSGFRKSSGPFLLTMPVPLKEARTDTPLLLADLERYSAREFADLVISYRERLATRLPHDQETWTPPWNVRSALALVRIGFAADQFWTQLRPN